MIIIMIKKIIYILILFIISAHIACAETERAFIEYNGYSYEFAPGDDVKFNANANKCLIRAEKTKSLASRQIFLNEAMRNYFLLSQIHPDSVEAQVGLARVYDDMNLDRYAQKHFFNAINLDAHNAKANYFFGDYYYTRNDLMNAQAYYNLAYQYGYANECRLNYRLANVYEKLGDIENAIKYYHFALRLNPKNAALKAKIRALDELNYSHSQYYLFAPDAEKDSKIKKKKRKVKR